MIICLQNPAWCWHVLKKHPLYLLPSSAQRLRWKNWNYLFWNSEGRVGNSDFHNENCHEVLRHRGLDAVPTGYVFKREKNPSALSIQKLVWYSQLRRAALHLWDLSRLIGHPPQARPLSGRDCMAPNEASLQLRQRTGESKASVPLKIPSTPSPLPKWMTVTYLPNDSFMSMLVSALYWQDGPISSTYQVTENN